MREESQKNEIQLYQRGGRLAEPLPPVSYPPIPPDDSADSSGLWPYWRVLRAQWWVILGVFLVVVLAVFVGTLLRTPVYRASGLLEIRRESADITPVETLVAPDRISDESLETQIGILKSATLAQRVARQLALDQVAEFNPPRGWSFPWFGKGTSPSRESDVLLRVQERFQRKLEITPIPGSRLVNVSFDSADPELAARAVNAVLSVYIEMRGEMSQRAEAWLAAEVDSTRAKLEASERRLQQYARAHGLLFLENSKGNEESVVKERLRQLQEQLTAAQATRYEKESLYDMVVHKGQYEAIPGAENEVLKDLTVRLADLRREYARLSATFKPDYPKAEQVKNQIEEIDRELQQERKRIVERITNDFRVAVRREELLRTAFREQEQLVNELAERMGEYTILKRDAETNKQLYDTLQQKLKEAGISGGLKANNVGIVDQAVPPRRPVTPNLPLNLALATVLGLVLGVSAAVLREHLDTTVKTFEEVTSVLHAPALAMIPSVQSLGNGRVFRNTMPARFRLLLPGLMRRASEGEQAQWVRIDRDGQRYSAFVEAFGALRTSVLLNPGGSRARSLLITSSQPREGKTTISANLAISLARLGRRVLLVDADIRRPSLHRLFNVQNGSGLTTVLSPDPDSATRRFGHGDWRSLVHRNVVPGLDLLASGRARTNPTELLSSWRMNNLLSAALLSYDFLILDAPALFINAADSRILAPLVDGVVLVVRSGATPREVVQRALTQAPNIIGVILNDLDVRGLPEYYRCYYGTGPSEAEPAQSRGPNSTDSGSDHTAGTDHAPPDAPRGPRGD